MMNHLVKKNVTIEGIAQATDEKLSPSLERLIIMEWLNRLDHRLVKFVQEKFSTELSAGSNILITMIETLSKNIDNYITILNASGAIGAGISHFHELPSSVLQVLHLLLFHMRYMYKEIGLLQAFISCVL